MMLCHDECAMHRDKKITLQRLKTGVTVDASGQIDKTASGNWETLVTAWAAVTTKGTKEFRQWGKTSEEATHLWTVISTTTTRSVTAADRIQWQGRTFDIIGRHDVDEAQRVVRIETKERL